MSGFEAAIGETARAVAAELDRLMPMVETPESRLIEAMRYVSMNGGKRLRPFLVMHTASLFNVSYEAALRTAAAVEMIHCYSLAHDDLPAMDNDDLRRGLPTCHKKYDEATAILAGDALLTKCFEVLAGEATHSDPAVRCELIKEVAIAAGAPGMVGGQMLDLIAEKEPTDMPGITRLQRMKTGMLIAISCEAGAILGKAPRPQRQALLAYAHDLGLVFQITDDLLDIEGSVEEVGKALRKDANAGKATFVSLLGVDRAREQVKHLAEQAINHLDSFGPPADLLRDAVRFVVARRS
jgi:farnesyl diphosphate synthase